MSTDRLLAEAVAQLRKYAEGQGHRRRGCLCLTCSGTRDLVARYDAARDHAPGYCLTCGCIREPGPRFAHGALDPATRNSQVPAPGGTQDDETQARLHRTALRSHGAGSTLLHNYMTLERQNHGLDWRLAAIDLAEAANRMHDIANKATALQCPAPVVHVPATPPPAPSPEPSAPAQGQRTAEEGVEDTLARIGEAILEGVRQERRDVLAWLGSTYPWRQDQLQHIRDGRHEGASGDHVGSGRSG